MAIVGGINANSTNQIVQNLHLTRNNAHVMDAFCPSQYSATVIDGSTDPTGQVITLATGVKLGAGRVRVTSKTTGEVLLVAFGESAAAAVANVPTGEPVMTGSERFKVPDLATHIAYQGATGASTGYISQGV